MEGSGFIYSMASCYTNLSIYSATQTPPIEAGRQLVCARPNHHRIMQAMLPHNSFFAFVLAA